MQELQSFRLDLYDHHRDAGDVPTRSIEICDETKLDRVSAEIEDNGNGGCRRLRGHCRRGTADRNDHCNAAADQVGRQCRQPIILTVGPAVFHRHILVLDITDFLQALTNRSNIGRVRRGGRAAEKTNHPHRQLLLARREPPRCRSAEQRDELASSSVKHGLPLPEPAVPAYPRLRMPRKRPQVLGGDLNRSESRRWAACPSMMPAQAPDFTYSCQASTEHFEQCATVPAYRSLAIGRRYISLKSRAIKTPPRVLNIAVTIMLRLVAAAAGRRNGTAAESAYLFAPARVRARSIRPCAPSRRYW